MDENVVGVDLNFGGIYDREKSILPANVSIVILAFGNSGFSRCEEAHARKFVIYIYIFFFGNIRQNG